MDVSPPAPRHPFAQALARHLPLLLVLVFAGVFLPSIELLFQRWIKWDEDLSHGLLVAGAFLILLYRSQPWQMSTQPTWLLWLWWAGLVLGSLAWFLFHSLNIYILEQLILVPLFALACAAVFGWRTAWSHRMLLLLPVFAIPVWGLFNDALLDLSAAVVGELVRLIRMPALIEGNSIFIPYGHILIADGCSGLRYFVIALTLGYLIGYLNRYTTPGLLITLCVAALIGLAANWIRIFILILVGYETQMQSSLMHDHEYFGWLVFGVLCLPAIYFAPVVHHPDPPPLHPSMPSGRHLLISILALALGPAANLLANPEPTFQAWESALPGQMHRINQDPMPMTVTAPENGYREHAIAWHEHAEIFIQVDQYQRRQSEDKLVPYIARLYNTEDWLLYETGTVNEGKATLSLLRAKSGGQHIAQLQWFSLGQDATASVKKAKLMQVPALFRGEHNFRIYTLQARCQLTDCAQAISSLQGTAQLLQTVPTRD